MQLIRSVQLRSDALVVMVVKADVALLCGAVQRAAALSEFLGAVRDLQNAYGVSAVT